MKKFLGLVSWVVVLFLIFGLAKSWAFSIAVDPGRIILEGKPGTKIEGTVKVSNNSPGAAQGFLTYAEDWIFNKEGGKEIKPAGSSPRSCASWIKLTPSEFEARPNSSVKVKYTIEIPKDAAGGYYAMLFFETALPKQTGGFTGAALKGRIGATLSLDIKGTTNLKGTITNMIVSRPDEDKPLKINFEFKNEGNVAIWGKGNLQVVDASGNSLWKSDFDNFNSLPEGTMEKSLEWSGKMNAGKYSAVVSIDLGIAQPVISEVPFEVVKEGDLEKMSAVAARKKPAKVYLKFVNSGNLNIETSGGVKIFNQKDLLVEEAVMEKDLVTPNSTKVFTVIFKKVLPKGKYKVVGEVKFDELVKTKEAVLTVN